MIALFQMLWTKKEGMRMAKKGLLATRLEKMQQSTQGNEAINNLLSQIESEKANASYDSRAAFSEEKKRDKKHTTVQQPFLFGDIDTIDEKHDRALSDNPEKVHWKLSTRLINILLVACCIYVLFLIYGVVVTDYQYNTDGRIEPQVLSVSELKEKDQYETIYYQYLHCRNLYEKVLLLDYRIGKGEEDPLTIAPEYEALLDEVTDLSIKTDALEVDTKYSQVKNLLLKWVKDDIAVYLQNMSAAISQNNADTANNALQDKDRVYSDFSIITQNMVAMGEKIQGVDLIELKEWTPETYVNKTINGE